ALGIAQPGDGLLERRRYLVVGRRLDEPTERAARRRAPLRRRIVVRGEIDGADAEAARDLLSSLDAVGIAQADVHEDEIRPLAIGSLDRRVSIRHDGDDGIAEPPQ